MRTHNVDMDRNTTALAGTSERLHEPDHHQLEVFLVDGKLVDVHLDGDSVYPTWFKIEWKETGEISAKVRGVRLSTRLGDSITIHTRP